MAEIIGGGPPINIIDSPIESEIYEIIGAQMSGFSLKFDTDAIDTLNEKITLVVEDDASEIETVENKEEKEEEETDYTSDTAHQESSSSIGDWTKLSINTLRTPVSKQLDIKDSSGTRKRDNFLKTKLGNWAKAKQDSVSVQQQVLLKQHRQKLAHNEDKHRQEMEHNKETHKQAMLFANEEHEVKMSILKLEKEKLQN
ncbi:unnamed protein product [Psylliodes chrysocephalus]|uniref:Uncharacterized protein n=1 Tax=Psylliodes chrysocephalus TaxID=3402493 RepID=A0A9P0G7K7_9CUCU|nr:unnamed protein product [Psylliodes chrysocephala]